MPRWLAASTKRAEAVRAAVRAFDGEDVRRVVAEGDVGGELAGCGEEDRGDAEVLEVGELLQHGVERAAAIVARSSPANVPTCSS